MNISAASLVKRSASQFLYIEINQIKYEVTAGQLKGNEYADNIVKQQNALAEKRGVITLGDDFLFFVIDMVKDNNFVEIKMVNDQSNYPDWYLESSILQATLYASLLKDVKTLDTPAFLIKDGVENQIIKVPEKWNYQLWFGADKYEIFPNDEIKEHYFSKAKLIKQCLNPINYSACKEFDNQFKYKEFSIFKPKFNKINYENN